MSEISKTIPLATYDSSTSDSKSVKFTFSGYEDHYLYSVLVKDTAQDNLETITSDQIISGLDYENQQAYQNQALTWPKGPSSSTYNEITKIDLKYDSLKAGTNYAVCVVAVNSYTSITNPLTNFESSTAQKCYKIATTGWNQDEDNDCNSCSCDARLCPNKDDSGYELFMCAMMAILAAV